MSPVDTPRENSSDTAHDGALEERARAELRSKGWKFLGARRARRASPYSRARGYEPIRKRNPTFAVGRGNREEFFKAVAELRAFRTAYRAAWLAFRSGLRDIVFPAGTLWMRVAMGVRVAPG